MNHDYLRQGCFQGLGVSLWAPRPNTGSIHELSHKAPFVLPFRMSIQEDGVIWMRQYPLVQFLTYLPATEDRPWADYTGLAAALGLEPARDGLVDAAARREAEVELNALVAEEYAGRDLPFPDG